MSKSTRITKVSDDALDPDQCLPVSNAPVDAGALAQFGKMGCIKREIADFYGISESTLNKLIHENAALSEAYRRGWVSRQMSLRHRQTQIALDDRRGNQQVAMLIWLGKQDPTKGGLGQQESFKLSGDTDHPLEVSVSSASELLAARIAQLVQRARQSVESQQAELNGSVIDIEPSRADGGSSLRREIEASQKPDSGTE